MVLVIPVLVQDLTVLKIMQPPSMQFSNINVTKKSLSPYKENYVEFCCGGAGVSRGKKYSQGCL